MIRFKLDDGRWQDGMCFYSIATRNWTQFKHFGHQVRLGYANASKEFNIEARNFLDELLGCAKWKMSVLECKETVYNFHFEPVTWVDWMRIVGFCTLARYVEEESALVRVYNKLRRAGVSVDHALLGMHWQFRPQNWNHAFICADTYPLTLKDYTIQTGFIDKIPADIEFPLGKVWRTTVQLPWLQRGIDPRSVTAYQHNGFFYINLLAEGVYERYLTEVFEFPGPDLLKHAKEHPRYSAV